MNNFNNLATCGFDCSKCPAYIATVSHDLDTLRKVFRDSSNKSFEELACLGCLKNNTDSHMCNTCYMRQCVKKKNINYCYECLSFPCEYVSKNLSPNTFNTLKKLNKDYYKK